MHTLNKNKTKNNQQLCIKQPYSSILFLEAERGLNGHWKSGLRGNSGLPSLKVLPGVVDHENVHVSIPEGAPTP